MKAGAVAASRSGGGTVAFSWEQEPGVSKQQSAGDGKKPAAVARRAEAVSRRTPATAKNVLVPAPEPEHAAASAAARPHRLRVPPPPGGPAVLPPGKTKKKSRPRDDPFLAAYLSCTGGAGRGGGSKGSAKLFGWTGLGLGLPGLGISCKSSCGAVDECVVRLARIPELDED
ncbi:hypothetical protein HU200_045229 [Digitaria exilis]|uniref:Uncharacterized protein n=1 Tax=Digitaria exilis TaxID=1010633 RepID=A0A835EC44_9POAL|nr:hypothetical protein HU200_045229 [Digitaria exilis]CAB3493716.1 unnamed protein product [Digitaria exilis]